MATYDIYFNDDNNSDNMGFSLTEEKAISYIERYNGTNHSYFEDYKGGTVSVVCNEDNAAVFETTVR